LITFSRLVRLIVEVLSNLVCLTDNLDRALNRQPRGIGDDQTQLTGAALRDVRRRPEDEENR
jgi:hypothetical protein